MKLAPENVVIITSALHEAAIAHQGVSGIALNVGIQSGLKDQNVPLL
jgi:hypothetical protein